MVLGGRYKLLERIGEGGMGSVWVAEQQQPVKRKVAVKLVKAGMDSRHVLARFGAERQALAMMDHPNIAKVYDGGVTDQGHPYFVMEYVKGIPFTDYCDQVRLPLRDRLALFIPVCQAIQHAHQKGIVHRDLKPTNILVCLYDGKPVPKVIDFGLAKALHQPLTDQTLHTGHGQMVGTPRYMSPEQAEQNNLDIDTRTDIYSLGVVLYELLTGTTPLERDQLQKAAYDEVLRLIRDVEAPRPSLRLSGSRSLPSVAAQRNIDPKALQRSLSGDLDWIVMKALEKERSRRYETATGFARDLDRFLNEEPVEARSPTMAYRARKFVTRYRMQVLATALAAILLVSGLAGTTLGLFRALRAEQAAKEANQKASESLKQAQIEQEQKNRAFKLEADHRRKAEMAMQEEQKHREIAEQLLCRDYIAQMEASRDDKEQLALFIDLSKRSPQVRLRTFKELFSRGTLATWSATRAGIIAWVTAGLDRQVRVDALQFLAAVQRDKDADLRIRAAAYRFALELDSFGQLSLLEALTATRSPQIEPFVQRALGVIERTDRSQLSSLAEGLVKIIDTRDRHRDWRDAASAIMRLPEDIRTHTVRTCVASLKPSLLSGDADVSETAASALSTFIPQIEAEACRPIVEATLVAHARHKEHDFASLLTQLVRWMKQEEVELLQDLLLKRLATAEEINWYDFDDLLRIATTRRTSNDDRIAAALLEQAAKQKELHVDNDDCQGLMALALAPSLKDSLRRWDLLITVSRTAWDEAFGDIALREIAADMRKLSTAELLTRWNQISGLMRSESGGVRWDDVKIGLAGRLTIEQWEQQWRLAVGQLASSPNEANTASILLRAALERLPHEKCIDYWHSIVPLLDVPTESLADVVACVELLAEKLEPHEIAEITMSQSAATDPPVPGGGKEAPTAIGEDPAARRVEAQLRLLRAISEKLKKATTDGRKLCILIAADRVRRHLKVPMKTTFTSALEELPKIDHELSSTCVSVIEGAASPGLIVKAIRLWLDTTGSLTPKDATWFIDFASKNAGALPDDFVVELAFRSSLSALAELDAALFTSTAFAVVDHHENGQAPRIWEGLIHALSTHGYKVSEARRMELILAIVDKYDRRDSLGILHSNSIIRTACKGNQRRVWHSILVGLLDKDTLELQSGELAVKSGWKKEDVFDHAVDAIDDPRDLAKILCHPKCVGERLDIVLRRLEELVFYGGQPALSDDALMQSEDGRSVRPVRQFPNVFAAAKWIEMNWPQFEFSSDELVAAPVAEGIAE
ncbi:Serine/threonine-protein kinase PknB [Planctomyces sp. SH-PL14]|nr:Serine/threonine-protein kinase PknB [Planctomyces sp. SH-PL14]